MTKFRCDFRANPTNAWDKGDSHWDTYEKAVSHINECCDAYDQRVVYEGRVVAFRVGENTLAWVNKDPMLEILAMPVSDAEKAKLIRELTLREAGGYDA